MLRFWARTTFLWVMAHPAAALDMPRVLILGDSHTYGQFGQNLHNNIAKKMGSEVTTVAICPATPDTYLETPKIHASCGIRIRKSGSRGELQTLVSGKTGDSDTLDQLLKSSNPSLIIIALGTNMGKQSVAQIDEQSQGLLRTLKEKRPDATIIWLGPPQYPGADKIIQTLLKSVPKIAGTLFLDGSDFNRTLPLPKSNPHFGKDKAGHWADHMFLKIMNLFKAPDPPKGKMSLLEADDQSPCDPSPSGYKIPSVTFIGLAAGSSLHFEIKHTGSSCLMVR